MEYGRDIYLKKLISKEGNGLVKIITGLRRSGKSYLVFRIFKNYLLNKDVPEDHIISIAFDARESNNLLHPDNALAAIKSKVIDNNQYYVLLDEVQLLPDFVSVLNSLMHIPNLDIFVTGSNSKFLSRDVITEFRGRGDEIHLYPLCFAEFAEGYDGDKYAAWAEFSRYGGLPQTTLHRTDAQKEQYLINIFETTYIVDILERHNLGRTQELNDLLSILASDIGALTNAQKIKNTFSTKLNSKISLNTIKSYIDYLMDAFLISEALRYDVKGRKYIGTPKKYYFEDIGLRNARLRFSQNEPTHILENILYNELRVRDFNVDVGEVKSRTRDDNGHQPVKKYEIDFIANKGNNKYYIQSALQFSSPNKLAQEKQSLLNVNDSFKKIIVTAENVRPWYDNKGIQVINIYDFLLGGVEGSIGFL